MPSSLCSHLPQNLIKSVKCFSRRLLFLALSMALGLFMFFLITTQAHTIWSNQIH